MNNNIKMLTMKETASLLNVSLPTLRQKIKNQSITSYNIAGRYRFFQKDIDIFLGKKNKKHYCGKEVKSFKNCQNNDMSLKDVASILNVAEETVRSYLLSKELASTKNKNGYKIKYKDLAIFLGKHKNKTIQPKYTKTETPSVSFENYIDWFDRRDNTDTDTNLELFPDFSEDPETIKD